MQEDHGRSGPPCLFNDTLERHSGPKAVIFFEADDAEVAVRGGHLDPTINLCPFNPLIEFLYLFHAPKGIVLRDNNPVKALFAHPLGEFGRIKQFGTGRIPPCVYVQVYMIRHRATWNIVEHAPSAAKTDLSPSNGKVRPAAYVQYPFEYNGKIDTTAKKGRPHSS
jgi:hypothetical protein